LRTFRFGYVQKMAQLRHGECPHCPHDVIDPRDLKFFRNVCGYCFRAEDDPFRWRERLPLARPGLGEVVIFSLVFLVLSLVFAGLGTANWGLWLPLIPIAVVWIFVLSFFRDPERTPPADAAALLAPADGTVTHREEVEDADFPGGRAYRISIFLSIFNVHVNRIPRTGRVLALRYFPGTFLDARRQDCHEGNEQLWCDFEELATGKTIRVKQIAGAAARRIVCWLKPGQEVRAGERYGMIKFGSRTDVLLPLELAKDVRVRVGDPVRGALTVIARMPTA
jgi:phosphatidylserine decarboxylase